MRHSSRGRVAERLALRPRAIPGEDSLDEHAPESRQYVGAECRQGAKLEREREHPLPHRHGRQHSIDQMRSNIGHAPAGTTRARRARLAGEGHEQVVAARVAVSAHESVGQDAAAQVAAKLLLHVARQRGLVSLAGVGEERLEMVAHDGVEHRFGGTPWTVGGGERGHGVPCFRRSCASERSKSFRAPAGRRDQESLTDGGAWVAHAQEGVQYRWTNERFAAIRGQPFGGTCLDSRRGGRHPGRRHPRQA